jgi:cobalt-zinc-cadmium efflux system membrane fusion protein
VSVDTYPGRVFAGRLTYIGDTLDAKTRTAKVRCEVPNRDSALKFDMFATVRIPVAGGRSATVIPAEAVQRIGDQSVAFVSHGGGRFEQRLLKLGETSEGLVEILEGLSPGTRVVSEGSFVLKSEAMKAELGHHEE